MTAYYSPLWFAYSRHVHPVWHTPTEYIEIVLSIYKPIYSFKNKTAIGRYSPNHYIVNFENITQTETNISKPYETNAISDK